MSDSVHRIEPAMIKVPAPTGWPFVAAFGLTLVAAGLLTHLLVSLLGVALLAGGLTGWFRAVFPDEAHVAVPLEAAEAISADLPAEDAFLKTGEENHRARLPLEIYPYSAGIFGGLVGGGAMALLALLYGAIGHHSVWYPVNLLAASGLARLSAAGYEQLLPFNSTAFLLATVIHVSGSMLVGILYGVALPIFPRRPILMGGLVAPLLWSSLLYSAQSVINPTLIARIDWPWFMAFQFVFGLVTGIVVSRRERVSTLQYAPFVARAGFSVNAPRERPQEPGGGS